MAHYELEDGPVTSEKLRDKAMRYVPGIAFTAKNPVHVRYLPAGRDRVELGVRYHPKSRQIDINVTETVCETTGSSVFPTPTAIRRFLLRRDVVIDGVTSEVTYTESSTVRDGLGQTVPSPRVTAPDLTVPLAFREAQTALLGSVATAARPEFDSEKEQYFLDLLDRVSPS